MHKSLIATLFALLSLPAVASELVLETWRVEDATLWKEKILPAFAAKHPDIKVSLHTIPSSDYDTQVQQLLADGKAGDLITCRPYDASLNLFKKGYLEDLTDFPGMENFPSFAKAAWQTDTGAQGFCLPVASVIQGFYYNKTLFKEAGLEVPNTRDAFFAALDKFKADGKVQPLALAAHDNWVVSELGYQNIGPNYWKGEDGRIALIDGKARFTDAAYRGVFEELARWRDYAGAAPADVTEGKAIELFTSGQAAVLPAGSWAISQLNGKVDYGVFPPPVAQNGDNCFFTDHTDMGIGINSKSPNKEAAKVLLEWMSSAEFAELYSNALPGFFSLSNHFFELKDPIAQAMMSWRDRCDSTIRISAQILSRGTPSFSDQLKETTQGVILGTLTPQAAVDQMQAGLDSWYLPQQAAKEMVGQSCATPAATPLPASGAAPTTPVTATTSAASPTSAAAPAQ